MSRCVSARVVTLIALLHCGARVSAGQDEGPGSTTGELFTEYSRGNDDTTGANPQRDALGAGDYETAKLRTALGTTRRSDGSLDVYADYGGSLSTQDPAANWILPLVDLQQTENTLSPGEGAEPRTMDTEVRWRSGDGASIDRPGDITAAFRREAIPQPGARFSTRIPLGTIPAGQTGDYRGTTVFRMPDETGAMAPKQELGWTLRVVDGAMDPSGSSIGLRELASGPVTYADAMLRPTASNQLEASQLKEPFRPIVGDTTGQQRTGNIEFDMGPRLP